MKVLHLPVNIASQAGITVRALREIGIDARCVVKKTHILESGHEVESLPELPAKRHFAARAFCKVKRWRILLDAIKWADVVHWHFRSNLLPMDLDIRYAAFLNKPRIVEFWGSDIRIPDIAAADNPYIARMYQSHPELAEGSRESSLNAQRLFARNGFECLIHSVEQEVYIQKCYFPSHLKIRARIIPGEYTPCYPDPKNPRPLVVHMPSKLAIKGTSVVLEAVETLRSRYDFDFQLIHGVEHSRAVELLSKADIVIDQLLIGSHGVAALEAMAMGKPVVCYIKPACVQYYPPELPIVNANPDNLEAVLLELLEDGHKRYDIGLKSRQYVEKYHDAHKVARNLVKIYEQLIRKHAKSAALEMSGKGV